MHVHFIINIDPCTGNSGETQLETSNNLKVLFDKYKMSFEIHLGDKGCFFTASKTILNRTKTIINEKGEKNSAVLWFEDDKRFNRYPDFKKYLEQSDEYVEHFWRGSAGCPTFHPCLWSGHMALQYLIPSVVNEEISYDPELLMMTYWRKNFKKDIKLHHHLGCSVDIGRQWQKQNNIKKWIRQNVKNKAVTYD
jgi:hypothetical protein